MKGYTCKGPHGGFGGSILFNYPNLLVEFDVHILSSVVSIENTVGAGTCGNHRADCSAELCPGVPSSYYSVVAVTHSQPAAAEMNLQWPGGIF